MQQLEITVCGRQWLIKRPSDLESLWANMDIGDLNEDERLPYWVEVWPASILLCRWLALNKERIAGQFCLDIGCGLGLTSLVGSWLGAMVVGIDYEQSALEFATANASANAVKPFFVAMDWREIAFKKASFPFIWAGDILYEARFFKPVEQCICEILKPEGEVWMAAPRRTVSQTVWEKLRSLGWNCQCVMQEQIALSAQNQTVELWKMQRKEIFGG